MASSCESIPPHPPARPQTRTPSSSASPGSSASPTSSQTPSMTASTSPLPYALSAVLPSSASASSAGAAAAGAASGLVISDSLPAVAFSLALNRCPGADAPLQGTASVVCSPVAGSGAPSLPTGAVVLAVSPSGLQALGCASRAAPPVGLPFSVAATAAFRSRAASGNVSCALVGSDGSGMGAASLPVTILPTLWPLWDDAVVVSDDGTLLSSALGSVNGTAALLAALPAAAAAACSAEGCTLSAAIANPSVVLAAVVAAFGGTALPNASVATSADAASASTFSLTLSGSTRLVLRSTLPAFAPNVVVAVGGANASNVTVSADGRWLFAQTPSVAAICSSAGAASQSDCGLAALTLSNPAGGRGAPPAARRAADGDSSAPVTLGATLSCPPFCPGAGVVPVPAASASSAAATGFVPAVVSSPGSAPSPLPSTAYATTSVGLYYARACSATGAAKEQEPHCLASCVRVPLHRPSHCLCAGLYTDPATGACTNASDPRSLRCAFGSGDNCQIVGRGESHPVRYHCDRPFCTTRPSQLQCPTGALCPGGSRAWPLPGYYSASASAAVVIPCTPPSPALRCTGWNVAAGRTQCGVAYRQVRAADGWCT